MNNFRSIVNVSILFCVLGFIDRADGVTLDGSSRQTAPAGSTLGATPPAPKVHDGQSGTASPFGFQPGGISEPGYPDSGFIDAQNIGVKWSREGLYAYWFMVQPDLGQPVYDFGRHDQQWSSVPAGIDILANIAPENPHFPNGYALPGSYIPVDEAKYTAFVQATVERYDGDGVNDMPGLVNPIRYWQVNNEPRQALTGFADLQRITYTAIKQACADCTVLIGGVAGFPEDYVAGFDSVYVPILNALNGQYVDVLDFHWYGTADGEYRLTDTVTGADVYQHIRDTSSASGFSAQLPIWITEMGSYSGSPLGLGLSVQTERQQALDYFKRFVYPLSRGVQKVFPAFGLIEGFNGDDGYFDHTGLIYDGMGSGDLGLGVKKLGYYTYKKMTEKLEGADWSTITTLRDGTGSDHLYLYRVMKGGEAVYIAWWDYFDEPGYNAGDTKDITINGLAGIKATVTIVVPNGTFGRDVPGYSTAFMIAPYLLSNGSITIPLTDAPVILEPDYAVDSMDLGVLMNRWGSNDVATDLDGSGTVDMGDLEILLREWTS